MNIDARPQLCYNSLVEGLSGFFIVCYHKIVPSFGSGLKTVRPSTSRPNWGLIIYSRKQNAPATYHRQRIRTSALSRSANMNSLPQTPPPVNPTPPPVNLACPHCGGDHVTPALYDPTWIFCDDCGFSDHVSEFEAAGQKLWQEMIAAQLSYEDQTGFGVADLEAQAAADIAATEPDAPTLPRCDRCGQEFALIQMSVYPAGQFCPECDRARITERATGREGER